MTMKNVDVNLINLSFHIKLIRSDICKKITLKIIVLKF